ncbi:MAG: hypothetical protein M1274_04000 [Actinobacteria bacterium]|nr:hypothetical protein [Actinomycetota bacterium]
MTNLLDIPVPTPEELDAELAAVRRVGITEMRRLKLPALTTAARAAGRVEPRERVGAYVIERMLRDTVVGIGGRDGELAAKLFGLTEETRGGRPPALRKMAAEDAFVTVEHFRHAYEPRLRAALADRVLAEIHDYRLRLARLRLDLRIPIHSRLAVEWLARFEAMYRIWTPLTGVGNELTAYRSTMLEVGRPWDQVTREDGSPYSQELQAAGCVTSALAHFARFLIELRDFEVRFGGLWLLPEPQAETELRDAVHRVVLASPNIDRDDSFLRLTLSEVPDRELHPFLRALAATDIGQGIHADWQDWASTCECTWEPGSRAGREYFPTHLGHPGISEQCDMHILIAACNDYCLILDDAWDAIADWYHDVPKPARTDRTAEEIYAARQDPVFKHLLSRSGTD